MTLEQLKAEMRDKAVWSSQCSNIKVLTLGVAERLIDSTHQATVEEIIDIVSTSRTLDEKYGVGVKEQTAREQVKADILQAIKK